MKPYPLSPTTGTIPPDKIPGREEELKNLQKLLIAQSVVIEEFRRMGKTLLLQKLEYITLKNNLPNKAIYFTVQNVKNAKEVTDQLLDTLRKEEKHAGLKITWNKCKALYNKLKPEKIDIKDVSFKLPEFKSYWKEALTACLEDIAEYKQEKGKGITLILDELPIMLWNWIQNKNAAEATELLDTLRTIGQTLNSKSNVRFVICGSIGMSVVLDHLRENYSYTGEPFNDSENFSVEAMSETDGLFLCECLYLSGFKGSKDNTENFKKICTLTENLPFYINKIFSIIDISYSSFLSEENIDKAYQDILTNPKHSDVFDQLHTRLTTYYTGKAKLMQQILNFLSDQTNVVVEKKIIETFENDEADIKKALERLTKEEYLKRIFVEDKRHYQFKYQLFKKWWSLNKA